MAATHHLVSQCDIMAAPAHPLGSEISMTAYNFMRLNFLQNFLNFKSFWSYNSFCCHLTCTTDISGAFPFMFCRQCTLLFTVQSKNSAKFWPINHHANCDSLHPQTAVVKVTASFCTANSATPYSLPLHRTPDKPYLSSSIMVLISNTSAFE